MTQAEFMEIINGSEEMRLLHKDINELHDLESLAVYSNENPSNRSFRATKAFGKLWLKDKHRFVKELNEFEFREFRGWKIDPDSLNRED